MDSPRVTTYTYPLSGDDCGCGSARHYFGDVHTVSEHALAPFAKSPRMAAARHKQFHLLPGGDVLATGVISASPDSVTIHLEGSIAAIPYNFDLVLTLDLTTDQASVTIELHQPVSYTASWTYDLHRVALGGAPVQPPLPAPDGYIGASLAAAHMPQLQGAIIGCALKCIGPAALQLLLQCLPSLFTGKQNFFACLVQQGGAALAQVTQCIAACKQ